MSGILETDTPDWSNRIPYHTFDTKLDTEFNVSRANGIW